MALAWEWRWIKLSARLSLVSTHIFEAVLKLPKDVSDEDVVFINLPENKNVNSTAEKKPMSLKLYQL